MRMDATDTRYIMHDAARQPGRLTHATDSRSVLSRSASSIATVMLMHT